jgi:hypothetical protein
MPLAAAGALPHGAFSALWAYQGLLQFIRKGERIALNNMEQSRSTGQVGCGSAPFAGDHRETPRAVCLQASHCAICDIRNQFLNNAGDKRALQWHILAGWRSRHKERRQARNYGRRRF